MTMSRHIADTPQKINFELYQSPKEMLLRKGKLKETLPFNQSTKKKEVCAKGL